LWGRGRGGEEERERRGMGRGGGRERERERERETDSKPRGDHHRSRGVLPMHSRPAAPGSRHCVRKTAQQRPAEKQQERDGS
jgi:hypothetical protein